jgi:ubiquinone/menaquinone biosynthesis C-methylase UbiE
VLVLKRLIKKTVSPALLRKAVDLAAPALLRIKASRIQRLFHSSSQTPEWLDGELLEELASRYPVTGIQSYAPGDVEQRGQTKARELVTLAQSVTGAGKRFLEVGCYDGMVCHELQRLGQEATGIDVNSGAFDRRALEQGVALLEMNAMELGFADESFDFVFSYDAFEHIPNPGRALAEAVRVVRKGGYIYLSFGPLYFSPLGAHLMESINVPYCHLLFPQSVIADFINRKGLPRVDFDCVNRFSIQDFRHLWREQAGRLKKVIYEENRNYWSLDMVEQYPSCFRSKTGDFESLLVSDIRVLFKKVS